MSRACAAASPGCQVSRSPPAQSGRVGSSFQSSSLSLGDVRYALERLRRRQWLRRIAQRLHPSPERGEHAQAPVLLVADLVRQRQQVTGKAMRDDTDLTQRRGNLIFNGLVWRLRDLVPVDRVGTDLASERGDDRRRRPLAQHKRCPPLTQARLQGAQRLRQPPSRRAAERPNARRLVVEHVNERNRRVRFGGCVQRGMVGNAKVVAVPNHGGHARIGSIEFPRICRGLCPLRRS